MKPRTVVVSLLIPLTFALASAGFGQKARRGMAAKPGPKASAPAVDLAEVVLKWIDQKKKGDEIEMMVERDFIETWQRVNITGTVKGTTKVVVASKPGMPFKARKNQLIHKMEYIEKGKKSFEFYVLLPKGEKYPDGDRLKITEAYIESNRGYGVKYGVKPVLIGGKVEQLPPD